ncbi:MAG: inositol monophosphatase family protein, partial [Rhizobiaceae bacterium]
VEHKGPQDRVSEADRNAELLIRKMISDTFPDDGILGEEFEFKKPENDAGIWVIDPIDGTDCFLSGIPSWCVSIAYMRAGSTRIGVIFDPIHDDAYWAESGKGAFINDRPLNLQEIKNADAGLIGIGHSLRVHPSQTLLALDRLMKVNGMFHRCGSGALSLAWVASGKLIGYFEPHMNSWDCLAGLLLVREAGGWTNDFLEGNGLHRGNMAIAAAPGMAGILKEISGLDQISKSKTDMS